MRPLGRVSIVSLLGRGEPPLDFNPLYSGFYGKGISLIAVNGKSGESYPKENLGSTQHIRRVAHMLALMYDNRLEPRKAITHRMHYTEMKTAYDMAIQRDKTMLGVVFDWSDVTE